MLQGESCLKIKILSSLVKFFPNEEPLDSEGSRLIAKNERLNFQIAIYNFSKSLIATKLSLSLEKNYTKE